VKNTKLVNSFIICLFLFVTGYFAISFYRIIRTTAPDFSIYYYSTLDVTKHINPYTDKSLFTAYNYPIASNVLLLPLLLFPYTIAQGLFLFLSFGALAGAIYLSIKIIYKKFSWKLFFLFLSLSLLSFPVKFTFGMGQSNLIGYFFLIYGFFLYKKQKYNKAGMALSISILFKPVLSFLFLYFLLQKMWKLLIVSLSVLLLCNVIAFSLYPKETVYYITAMLPRLFDVAGREVYFNQGFIGFIARITSVLLLRSIISFLFSLLIIGLITYRTIRRKHKTLSFALFLTALPMIDTLSWQHHFVFLIFPFIFIGSQLWREKRKLLLFLLFISYVFVSWNIKNPKMFFHFPKVLLLSHVFYATAILFFLLFFSIGKTKQP